MSDEGLSASADPSIMKLMAEHWLPWPRESLVFETLHYEYYNSKGSYLRLPGDH